MNGRVDKKSTIFDSMYLETNINDDYYCTFSLLRLLCKIKKKS